MQGARACPLGGNRAGSVWRLALPGPSAPGPAGLLRPSYTPTHPHFLQRPVSGPGRWQVALTLTTLTQTTFHPVDFELRDWRTTSTVTDSAHPSDKPPSTTDTVSVNHFHSTGMNSARARTDKDNTCHIRTKFQF